VEKMQNTRPESHITHYFATSPHARVARREQSGYKGMDDTLTNMIGQGDTEEERR
jgi:hypothetical protein